MPEINQLVNKPEPFIINEKTVFVECHPLGAVSLIIAKLIEKAKFKDKKEFAILNKPKDEKIVRDIDQEYADLSDLLFGNDALDAEIVQLMVTPAKKWAEKHGQFETNDFPVSIEDINWYASEEMILKIVTEWQARNPRFDRQKKMLNLKMES